MNIIDFFKDYALIGSDSKELDTENKNIFLNNLTHLKDCKKVCFIFRGISNNYQKKVFKTSASDNIELLSSLLFAIGEKGRRFIECKMFIDKDVANVDSLELNRIWDSLHNIACDYNQGKLKSKPICCFFKRNSKIVEYFSNIQHKVLFTNYGKTKDAKIVKDYYYSLFHTMGRGAANEYGVENSYFLSASLSNKVAQEFGRNGIVICGWMPRKGLKRRMIKYTEINAKNVEIEALGLPIYSVPIYPKQEEICLKCGLLPNYIIGFGYRDKFYVNPNFLNIWEEDIICDGLKIEQPDFLDNLKLTNYGSMYFYVDGEYYFIDNNAAQPNINQI